MTWTINGRPAQETGYERIISVSAIHPPRPAPTLCHPFWGLHQDPVCPQKSPHLAGVALVALVPFDAVVAAVLCVAGVALGDIVRHFAWQAKHLATSTFALRGRRGTCGTGLALVTRLGPV